MGNLTVGMRSPPLHVGYVAPLFEAKTLDGKDIRLADYRGRFVLLSFWQPTFHPELDRLKELYQTYGSAGKLAIVDFAGGDTLEEVKEYLAEHKTEWPEIISARTGMTTSSDSTAIRGLVHPARGPRGQDRRDLAARREADPDRKTPRQDRLIGTTPACSCARCTIYEETPHGVTTNGS